MFFCNFNGIEMWPLQKSIFCCLHNSHEMSIRVGIEHVGNILEILMKCSYVLELNMLEMC